MDTGRSIIEGMRRWLAHEPLPFETRMLSLTREQATKIIEDYDEMDATLKELSGVRGE